MRSIAWGGRYLVVGFPAGIPSLPLNLTLLRDLCDTMTNASLCALGGLAPLPVLSALRYFPRDFGLEDEGSSGMH